jgi:hypothetical protein
MTIGHTRIRIYILPAIASLFLVSLFAGSCSQPRLFTREAGEFEGRQAETVPYGYNDVWASLLTVVSDYRIHTKDPERGVLNTWWRTKVVKETGELAFGDRYNRGVKIEDRSDGASNERNDFEIRNRLMVQVIRDTDSTTTIIVTNIFKAGPHNYSGQERESGGYAGKAFDMSVFDTREQYTVIKRIAEVAGERKKR